MSVYLEMGSAISFMWIGTNFFSRANIFVVGFPPSGGHGQKPIANQVRD